MSVLDLYADDIESGIQRHLANPPPPEPTSFDTWSFMGAGAKGVPKGLLELGAGATDALAAVTEIGLDSLSPEKQQMAKERSDAIRIFGRATRKKSKEFASDPETSQAADVVINNLSSTVTQAVASVAVAGVGVGSLVFGASTGRSVYLDLIEKGVDKETAMKVAGVTGVVNAAGVVVPLGSATKAGTAALVAASGPGAYMAQEKLSKEILQRAGYEKEAQTHDPFDPLGLAISTVLPGIFGAAHALKLSRTPKLEDVVKHIESGGRRYGKDGQLLTSPKGAQGEMQVMPYTASDPGFGVAPARDSSPEELARVGRDYLDAMVKRYGDRDKALAAYNAGPGAVDDAIKKGGNDWLSMLPNETQKYVGKANKMMGDATVARADQSAVDAARVKVADEALMKSMPDHPEAVSRVASAADEVAAGRMPDVEPMPTTSLPEFKAWFGDSKGVDAEGKPLVVYHGTNKSDGGDAFTIFDTYASNYGLMGQGGYFTADPSIASSYTTKGRGDAPTVYPVYLSIKNPIDMDGPADVEAWQRQFPDAESFHEEGNTNESWYRAAEESIRDQEVPMYEGAEIMQDGLRAMGFDGITHMGGGRLDKASVRHRVYVAFDPEQIKSATGNSGKFDPKRPNLTDPLAPSEVSPRVMARDATNNLPPPSRPTIEPDATAIPQLDAIDALNTERIQTLMEQNPDLPVKLPGSDETLTLKTALQRYIDEAHLEMKQADLVKAAIDCAIGA